MTEPETRAIDRPGAVLALLLAGTVTETIFLILPSFVGAVADVLGLDADRLGILGSADLAGIALTTATGPWWVRRLPWRGVTLTSLALFLGLSACCFGVHAFLPLLLLRFLAGLAAGAGYAVALAGLVETRRADRNMGLFLCLQVLLAGGGLYAVDVVPVPWRLAAVYGYTLAWGLPTLLVAWRFLPSDPGLAARHAGSLAWRRLLAPGAAAVLGAGLYMLMIGSVWGYMEGVARSAGLSLSQTGSALSFGLFVSLIGSGAATLLGARFGRALPLLMTAAAQLIALFFLSRLDHFGDRVTAFYVFNSLFQIFWSFIIAYFILIFADLDESGRFVSWYGAAAHTTVAIGPYVGAVLVAGGDYRPLLLFGIVCTALCYTAFLLAVALNPRRPAAGRALEMTS